MTLVVRSVLGAALLLTGASAAMAQSAKPVASTAAAASNAPVAGQTVQTAASTATAESNNAPIAAQPQKPRRSGVSNNADPYGGNDPNSTEGMRAFFVPQY